MPRRSRSGPEFAGPSPESPSSSAKLDAFRAAERVGGLNEPVRRRRPVRFVGEQRRAVRRGHARDEIPAGP